MATLKENETVQREQNTIPETKVDVSQNQEIAEAVVTSENELATHSVEASTKIETQALAQQTITENEQRESKVLEQHMQAEENTLAKGTKAETKTLQEEIERTPKALSNREIAKIKDNETLKLVADERIKKCKALRSGIRSREGNGESKNWLKQEISGAITNMESMVSDINRLKKKGMVYSNLDVDKNRIGEIIYNYYTNREPARQMISLGMKVPHINSFVDSKKDAKRLARHEKRNQEYQQRMAELLKDPMLLHLLGDDQSALNQYYKDVISGYVEPSTHPFYTRHMQSFLLMERVEPELYGALAPKNRLGQITYNTYCQRNPAMYEAYCRDNNIVCRPKSFNEKMGKNVADVLAKVFPGIDSDPRKRQAREKAGSVLALGGAAVLGFKFLQSLFSKKHEGKWKEVGLYGGGLLALLNADKIVNWTKDAFGRHPAEKTKMLSESFKTYGFSDAQAIDMADRYIGAPVTTISALHFIPIYELESQHILENNNGEINFIYGNFENYVNKFSWDRSQKEQVLKAGKKLDKDKSIGTGLKAFGIATREKLRSLFGSDKKKTLAQTEEVQNGWGKMVERVQHGVNKDLYNHGLRVKNPDDMDTIMAEYGSGQKSKEEVNKLMLDRMKRGLLELASDDKSYTINDMLTKAEFTSKINLENMTMNGFIDSGGTEIRFDSYGDLFDAVNISNWIKNHFNRPAKSENPFHIDPLTGRIEFDNTNRYDLTHNETSVVKLLTLKKNSTLFKNRKFYVDYLNKQRKETRIEQNKVDLSGYPILKEIGIDFMDKDEAKNAEIRLDQIKKQLRTSTPGLPGYTPFFIKGKKLGFKKIDGVDLFFPDIFPNEFIGKSLNLSNFPSLTHNSDKFLKFMNNPNNNMRGYQVRQRI